MTTSATAPGTPTASPSSAPINLYLRSWTTYPSIGPVNNFGRVPLVISNGWYMSVKSTATAAPYPMYVPPTRRAVSQAGLARIVAEARTEGLLGTVTSFDCPDDPNVIVAGGAGPDYLVLVVDGVSHQLSSNCPDAGALPTPSIESAGPGTWGAFQRFKSLLADPVSWLGPEIGPEAAYDPDKLAVLAELRDDSGGTPIPANVVQWPLTPFASFGISALGGRCAVVSGSDVAALLPVVNPAYDTTVFRD
ncbi:MAG: hypothetical protein ACXWNR_04505, partial [Candidatus Limnocylindrales bacterium]